MGSRLKGQCLTLEGPVFKRLKLGVIVINHSIGSTTACDRLFLKYIPVFSLYIIACDSACICPEDRIS